MQTHIQTRHCVSVCVRVFCTLLNKNCVLAARVRASNFCLLKNLPQLRVFPFIFLAVVVYRCVNLYSLEIFLGHTVFSFSCSPLTGGVAEKKLSKNCVPRYIFLSIHPKLSQQSTVYVYVYMYMYMYMYVYILSRACDQALGKKYRLKITHHSAPCANAFWAYQKFSKNVYLCIYYIIL